MGWKCGDSIYFVKRDHVCFLSLFLRSGRKFEVVLSSLELGICCISRTRSRKGGIRSFRSYLFFLLFERIGEAGAW